MRPRRARWETVRGGREGRLGREGAAPARVVGAGGTLRRRPLVAATPREARLRHTHLDTRKDGEVGVLHRAEACLLWRSRHGERGAACTTLAGVEARAGGMAPVCRAHPRPADARVRPARRIPSPPARRRSGAPSCGAAALRCALENICMHTRRHRIQPHGGAQAAPQAAQAGGAAKKRWGARRASRAARALRRASPRGPRRAARPTSAAAAALSARRSLFCA
jgi:hypothetical protein